MYSEFVKTMLKIIIQYDSGFHHVNFQNAAYGDYWRVLTCCKWHELPILYSSYRVLLTSIQLIII